MEVTLTTPFNPGDVDKGKSYDKLRIVYISIDPQLKTVQLTIEAGCYVNAEWHRSVLGRSNVVVGDEDDPSYTDIMGLVALEEETAEELINRVMYGYLQTKFPEYAGTIA